MISRSRRQFAKVRGAVTPTTVGLRRGVIESTEEMHAFLRGLPAMSTEVRIVVSDLDLLRHMVVLGQNVRTYRCLVGVSSWVRPFPGWSGRMGHLESVMACTARFPAGAHGHAEVDLTVGRPTSLDRLARAAYSLLGVTRGLAGEGVVEIGTSDLPSGGLALLPSRVPPGVAFLPGGQLEGAALDRADIGLTGRDEMTDWVDPDPDDPERTMVRHRVQVATTGRVVGSTRAHLPLVDLNVHNPIGRLSSFIRPAGDLALRVHAGNLCFDPVGDTMLEGWARPAGQVLAMREVRTIRHVEAVDLSGLAAPGADEAVLLHRVAELAATGVILHSLPTELATAPEVLGPALYDLVRAPYASSAGLRRDLRSVPQRRCAMHRFGGFFELASHAEKLGHRLLPTVSVVLSSRRPARLARVLEALTAQTYPHVEVHVALHGSEDTGTHPVHEAASDLGTSPVHFDGSVPFGAVLAELARRASGDLVVKFDDDDIYGPHVIDDLVLAYLYSNADVVGKTTEYLYFEGIKQTVHRRFSTERYHYQLAGGTMMLSRAALGAVGGWRPTRDSTDRSVLMRIGNAGGIGYRTHGLGYVYVRHAEGHTWETNDSRLLLGSVEQWPGLVEDIMEIGPSPDVPEAACSDPTTRVSAATIAGSGL